MAEETLFWGHQGPGPSHISIVRNEGKAVFVLGDAKATHTLSSDFLAEHISLARPHSLVLTTEPPASASAATGPGRSGDDWGARRGPTQGTPGQEPVLLFPQGSHT